VGGGVKRRGNRAGVCSAALGFIFVAVSEPDTLKGGCL